VPTTASAVQLVADGYYDLVIRTTAINSTSSGNTSFNVGTDGNWQSTFTFGGTPGGTSNGMTDNDTHVLSADNIYHGSGIVNDGLGVNGENTAGVIGILVSGTNFSVVGESTMSGTIDDLGNMTFDPTGRLGATADFPALYDNAWNIDNWSATGATTNTSWQTFTTNSTSDGDKGTINGADVTLHNGDKNGDGVDDYKAVLVSSGRCGLEWGDPGFFGCFYYETWKIDLLSQTEGTVHNGFNVDTIFQTAGGNFAQYTANSDVALPGPVVPIPAAVWLFGSGLLGLVGVARRKQTTT